MAIGLACLWFSHYVLGFTSLLADNISSNVIGLALGTVFRFWLYRSWVFRPRILSPEVDVEEPVQSPRPSTGPILTAPTAD
jgi:putative flippase GtrA